MAGLDRNTPQPTALTVHQASRVLEVAFDDGAHFRIPFELMRVYSPSAEVQGHGPGQEVLQTGKREVGIDDLSAVGHYAVQPRFSDGHDTGIFSWDYLYKLGRDPAPRPRGNTPASTRTGCGTAHRRRRPLRAPWRPGGR